MNSSAADGPDRNARELVGQIDRVVWISDERDFLIAKLTTRESIKGPLDEEELQPGVRYRFLGKWEDSPKHGLQFAFGTYVKDTQHNRAGVVKYLVSEASGVGEKKAERLWELFGADAVAVLRESPERVAAADVLTYDQACEASGELKKCHALEKTRIDLFTLFAGRGFTARAIQRSIAEWGAKAADTIRRNPFIMLASDIPSAGFKRCDRLYLDLGFRKDRLKRQMLCAWNHLHEDSTGHTWFRLGSVEQAIIKNVTGARVDPIAAVVMGKRGGWLQTRRDPPESDRIFVAEWEKAHKEKVLADAVRRLLPCRSVLWPQELPTGPSEHQCDVIHRCLTRPVGILAGQPGVGKTYSSAAIIRQVTSQFGSDPSIVAMCAPTGKAAVRLTAAMRGYGLDLEATTIHRLLEIGRNGHDGKGWGFMRNAGHPLEQRFIFVDECFHYKQPVLTQFGWQYIGKIAEQKLPIKVWSRNPKTGNLELKDIVGWLKKPRPKKMLRITAGRTNSKRSTRLVRCTTEQKILTPDGYKRAASLNRGDRVIVRGVSLTPTQRSDSPPPIVSQSDTCECSIQDVAEEEQKQDGYPHVYDIEVKDHHNYVAGNMIVSNCSMLDVGLAADLFSACADGTHILLIGDPYQLPPVGHGAPLRDIIASDVVPCGELTEIHRNAGTIVKACRSIKNGEKFATVDAYDPVAGDNLIHCETATSAESLEELQSILSQFKESGRFDPVWDCQVLVAVNKRGEISRAALNKMLQGMLNPEADEDADADEVERYDEESGELIPAVAAAKTNPFRVDDKIVCVRNTWAKPSKSKGGSGEKNNKNTVADAGASISEVFVANGEIGRVTSVAPKLAVARFENPRRLIDIPIGKIKKEDADDGGGAGDDSENKDRGGRGCDYDLAYAITGHKSQGSEWPCVIVMIDEGAGMVASREWVYTSISRASKLCIMIGKRAVVDRQCKRVALGVRKTFLLEMLQK